MLNVAVLFGFAVFCVKSFGVVCSLVVFFRVFLLALCCVVCHRMRVRDYIIIYIIIIMLIVIIIRL